MENKPNFYAILPATVRYDERLNAIQKLFYAEISALSTKEKRCWATNKYFEDVFGVSTSTVTRALNGLIDLGYLKRVIVYKDGTKEIERRYLYICEIANTPIVESDVTPIVKNEEDNNTREEQYKKEQYIGESQDDCAGSRVTKEKQLQEDFEKLWELYPNKKGKTAAFKAYKRAIKDGVTNKEIQTGIVAYKKQIAINRTEKQYIKHGGTFFNQRCWEDEDLKEIVTTSKQQETNGNFSDIDPMNMQDMFKNRF